MLCASNKDILNVEIVLNGAELTDWNFSVVKFLDKGYENVLYWNES